MKSVTSTAGSTPRTKFAAWAVGLFAAFAMLLGLASAPANAAVVGNPGTFTAVWNSGQMKQGNVTWPLGSLQNGGGPLTFQMNVNSAGAISIPSVSFADVPVPGSFQSGNIGFLNQKATIENIRLNPQATSAWSGTVNPSTGGFTLSTPMKWVMKANSSSSSGLRTGACNVNSVTTINASSATAGGSPYVAGASSGTVRAVANPITLPGANDCAGQVTLDQGSINAQTNTFFGLPGSGNLMDYGLTITPAIKAPVTTALTVAPAVIPTTGSVNFDASGSEILAGLKACADPSPAEPACGYRWDFDGDGNVDQVTNAPTTSHVYPTAGDFQARVTIFDVNGDSDADQKLVKVQTPPVTTIDSHPAATTKEVVSPFGFSLASNPHNATFVCSLDGAAFSACSPGNFNAIQADDTTGSHNFKVKAVTPEGIEGPVADYSWTIDRVKPRVTITPASLPVNPTNVTSANFAFTADKPGSTLECQLDGGTWVACGSNSSGTQNYNGLTESPNPHQFRIRATDPLGNIGGDGNPGGGAYSWRVDLTAPVPTFVNKPAQPSNVVSPLITWSNNEPIQTALCRLKTNGSSAPWSACDSLTSIQFTDMADNQYEISVRVQDIAGNWSALPLSHAWLLETVAPALDITKGPASLNKRSSAQVFFSNEPGANVTCQLDSRPVQDPCASGVKWAYIEEGSHMVTVIATDAALNSTTKTYSWSVKTIQPIVSIVAESVPDSSSTVDTADFELATANGDAECRLDGASWTDCESNEGQSYEGLSDGNHTFEVRAVDAYDNVSAIDAYSWLVATAGPEVEFTSTPLENTNESSATFGFDVTSADDTVVTECSLDGLDPFDCADPAAVVGLEDGDHTFTVTATDTAGVQGSDVYQWNVKAKIPGLAFDSTPDSISDSAEASFEFSSDEDPDVGYECSLDGADWTECESPVAKSSLSQGAHTFSIRATDSVGNAVTESYSWTVDTVAPVVTFGSKPAATTQDVAELISFTVSESGTSIECSLDNAAFGACTSPTLVKGLATGAHSFRVRATDLAGNQGSVATANWTITAASVQSVPVVGASAVTTTGSSLSSQSETSAAPKSGKAKVSKAKKSKAKKLKNKKRKALRKAQAK